MDFLVYLTAIVVALHLLTHWWRSTAWVLPEDQGAARRLLGRIATRLLRRDGP